MPCSARLAPATSDQFRNELTACLSLVVPVGMTEESRRDWLTVAWETLKHLPADLLHDGCQEARAKCDHPSKIVPAIVAATAERFEGRKRVEHVTTSTAYLPAPPKHVMERRGEPMDEADTAELNRILESLNATARYRMDGTRYFPNEEAA